MEAAGTFFMLNAKRRRGTTSPLPLTCWQSLDPRVYRIDVLVHQLQVGAVEVRVDLHRVREHNLVVDPRAELHLDELILEVRLLVSLEVREDHQP